MKKIFSTLMIASSMLFVSCSSNTPSGVVKKTLQAIDEKNFEVYARNLYVADLSDPEKVERDIQDFIKMLENAAKNNPQDKKLKNLEILDESKSKSGKWVCVTYLVEYTNGTKEEREFYLTKDNNGEWKISLFGTKQLMEQ